MATLTDITAPNVATAPADWTSAANGDLELVASADDGDYGYDATNQTGAYDQGYLISTVDADFASMDTVFVELRYQQDTTDPDLSIDSIEARIVRDSDGTWMAGGASGAFITLDSSITTSWENSGAVEMTSINSATNDKTSWDGARLEIRWNKTRSMGGATIQCRVSAATISGTYTAATDPTTYIAGVATASNPTHHRVTDSVVPY